jgi:hypothetical protein
MTIGCMESEADKAAKHAEEMRRIDEQLDREIQKAASKMLRDARRGGLLD